MCKHELLTVHARDSHAGFHQFKTPEGEPFGSFEVFYEDDTQPCGAGWYWHPCQPGCLPDGDSTGAFTSSKAAYDDAVQL